MQSFFDRLDKYMEYSGLNDNQVTVATGIGNGILGKGRKRGGLSQDNIAKLLLTYPDLNADWLITGRGQMLKLDIVQLADPQVQNKFHSDRDRSIDHQSIPLYSFEASAGMIPAFSDIKPAPVDYLSLPDLPPVDGAIYVRGDSMYPLLKSGDIVLYKRINDLQYGILWGEMYLISATDDEGFTYTVIKYVQKSERKDHIKLVSHNPHHSPTEIRLDMIRAMAIVKASVRYNTMG